MPVGISFENSSLKTSFSLSSLPAPATTPEKSVKHRQFNSLTKNRVKATAVRRSWGSTASDHREEFWSVLQANYNYIMDNQLIDNCHEVDGDLSINTGTWTLKEFYAQFSDLYSWLNSVQETIYGKEENITDKALRAHCVNKVLEKSSSLKLFNDQASQLVQLYPEVQEEVGWRATHLNSKWDSILSILGPSDCDHCDQDTCLDIDHELKCLRKWFKVMESRLQPLDFRAKYTKTEIETKALELNVLHRDIENHGKIVGSVVKLCKKTSETRCNTINIRRIANGLERRWHLLFLRSLEWQCYLESLSKRQTLRNSASSSESDSDCYREPANKYPRLSEKGTTSNHHIDNSSSEDESVVSVNEDGMTENNTIGIDTIDGITGLKHTFNEDHYTKSNRTAPNLATYYFKHEETEDSDMDKIDQNASKTDTQSTFGETSEEEWTYTKNTEIETEDNGNNDNQHELQETIESAKDECLIPKPKPIPEDTIRELVLKAEELVSPEKCRKTDRGKVSKVTKWLSIDKPDDSCDASGEDDEKESQTSEDFEASTMTLRYNSQNTSFSELHTPERQWRNSCVLPLSDTSPSINNFSISESALHKINLTSNLDRYTAISSNTFVNGNNSTSSTVEEISPILAEKSPVRRKKLKTKKKPLPFGKSDSHLLYNAMLTSQKQRHLLIKSGSFSGYSCQNAHNERNSCSDPVANNYMLGGAETSTTSGAESDEEFNRRLPLFKPGLKTRYLHNSEIRDDSPGKSSLNTTEEQSSSLSEAWDNYQENYLSEPYSESHDSDAARKLLNFGEDYRNFIDSQSDWSAFSDMSPTFKRKALKIRQREEEVNTDDESLKQLIKDSRLQLTYAEEIFNQVKIGINNGTVTNQLDDLMSTCDRHIELLNHINESSSEYKMTNADKTVTAGTLHQWKTLKNRCIKIEEYRKLLNQINELKAFINSTQVSQMEKPISYNNENIQNEIDGCNKLLEAIKCHASKLSTLNAVIHRFTLDNQDSNDYVDSPLKAAVLELYEQFENARTMATEKLAQIESLLPAWKTLETRLDQLQRDLNEDKKTMHLLDSLLTKGYPVSEFITEGSFSDSGISDEGSEHDIRERQGRLAAIRRLVRQLEVGLAPNSRARLLMREKLEAAEEELKALQLRCRTLIERTAPERLSQDSDEKEVKPQCSTAPDSGDSDPGNEPQGQSWFRRTFKASLAFQLVILTFVCLSCLFEPRCCDYMNNYSWSFSPKLHYEGRPPI